MKVNAFASPTGRVIFSTVDENQKNVMHDGACKKTPYFIEDGQIILGEKPVVVPTNCETTPESIESESACVDPAQECQDTSDSSEKLADPAE